MPALPDSVRFALWFNALGRGITSLDDARDKVVGDDAAHDLVLDDETLPLILAMGRLSPSGPAGVALPVAGDLLGLAGPAEFNKTAVEIGEAVILSGGLGLVPHRAGAGVTWLAEPAEAVRQVPDLSEADTALRHAVTESASALAELDVARWNPDVADELMALRTPVSLPLPPDIAQRPLRMLTVGARCRGIVDLALRDDGGSVTASEAAARRDALVPLQRAVRRALVAATSYADQR